MFNLISTTSVGKFTEIPVFPLNEMHIGMKDSMSQHTFDICFKESLTILPTGNLASYISLIYESTQFTDCYLVCNVCNSIGCIHYTAINKYIKSLHQLKEAIGE